MKTAVRKHRLTSKQVDLESIRGGTKTCTVRFTKAAAAARPGEAPVLQVGAYNRPTVLEAVVVRVLQLDLEPELHRCFDLPPDVMSLKAGYEFYGRPLEPDADTAPELLEALRDSGGQYAGVLGEAAERGMTNCVCLWWQLA